MNIIHPKHGKYELGEPVKVFTVARISFLHFYIFVSIILIAIFTLLAQHRLNIFNGAILVGLVLFGIKFPEYKRLYTHYKLMPLNVQKITGIFRKDREKIMMDMIGRMDIYQDPYQRLFNFGSIKIKSLTGEQILQFYNIKNPRKITHIIEKLKKLKMSGLSGEKLKEKLDKLREEV